MSNETTQRFPQLFQPFLLLTAGLTGGLVMAVEVLGARVIAPFFGVSLFVWTALIAVTLLALAAGYVTGGRWADRSGSPALLFSLIAASGVLLLLVPFAKAAVLQAALPLGLRWGAFIGALALFGPPLFLLGCVSPFLVRLAAREWSQLGRTVGLMYAISTAGSFLGTVLTGYYLVAELGLSRAFHVSGALLLALSAVYFALFRGQMAALLLPMVALLAASIPLQQGKVVLADGTVAQVVDSRDSYYGHVQVVDYRGEKGHIREMLIDGQIQGGIDVATGQSIYEYSYMLEHLTLASNPGGKRALVIGLGTGTIPRRYAARGIETEVVDIEPAVVAAAHTHFGFPASQRTHLIDARYFLATAKTRYDYIILDVFSGDSTPGYLLSREALELVRARLEPGGVLGINLIGSLAGERRMTASVMRTLEAAFPWVRIYPLYIPGSGESMGNISIVAGIGEPLDELPALDETGLPLPVRDGLRRALAQRYVWNGSSEGIVLTDDYNPIDVIDLTLKEAIRRGILDATPHEILLSGTTDAASGRALAA
ncbi:MAG: fused MFS/spermidine synthase [Nitrosomonadales bacterium]|nr:fused MFS/spermidine synthase [Nitrosomonadales bacterium]